LNNMVHCPATEKRCVHGPNSNHHIKYMILTDTLTSNMDETNLAAGRRRWELGFTVWVDESDPGQGLVRIGERLPNHNDWIRTLPVLVPDDVRRWD